MIYEGPPPEAYSRVTDPEKFRPIAVHAERVISELARQFEVDVSETVAPATPGDAPSVIRSVSLVPKDEGAAPIQISFTVFPGVRVKFGRGTLLTYPGCGCDACGETAESEIARFDAMVEDVVAGRFSERTTGFFWKHFEFEAWSDFRSQRHRERLSAHDPRNELPGAKISWHPWPKKAAPDQDA